MSTTSPCSCQTERATKGLNNDRPRYYSRQLVTPDDLTLEQDYFRAKLRRHNRIMHGWGVVCGARVVASAQKWKVLVKPGYVLGPFGDEISIEADVCVDVRNKCTPAGPPATPGDCGCTEAQPPPTSEGTMYIAVRYKEMKSRLIRVPLGGCGCEDSACEYSRYSDGYEICILDECPTGPEDPPAFDSLSKGAPPDCPPLPTDPWVVLSAFTVDAEGTVSLQECDCRRQALGMGQFWWTCGNNW
jgi:hypothetical protein